MELLLNSGADVNARGIYYVSGGWGRTGTTLQAATMSRHGRNEKVVQMLIEKGAVLEAQDEVEGIS